MPKRKQGEVDNEGVQDFELIELLIREAAGARPSTSTQQGSDFESFKARFQSYIDQIPSYLHSVGKEGFFPHFFLGSFSTLIDTEIAKKLKIKEIYFRFDTPVTLKVAIIKEGEIKSSEDAADKVRLFVIAESGSTKKKFSYGELDKILSNIEVVRNHVVRRARNEGKLDVRLVEITKERDAKGKMAGISVNVKKSSNLDNDASTTHEFKEIKKGVWDNPESDIAELTNSDKQEVKKSLNKVLKKIGKIHSGYRVKFKEERLFIRDGSLTYVKEAREAAHHGFVAGVLVNFRYRHNLRVYLEQFAGRGYADIVLVPRGKDRSLNAVPIIIEMKAATKAELKEGKIGEKSKTTPTAALKQAEDYTKGFQPNVMRVLTTANDMLCVGVNLDHSSPISDIVAKSRDQVITPLFDEVLVSINEHNNRKIDKGELKERIQNNIERIYHTFPGTGEKGDNHYFSRFLLGQSLLLNEVRALERSFKKHVFIYEENIPTEAQPEPKSQRLKDRKSEGQDAAQISRLDQGHGVVTMVFIPSNDQKSVCVMNIVETDGRDNVMRKGIPLDQLQQEIGERKIVELNLNFNIKKKSKFKEYFSVEVGESVSLEQYNRRQTNKFEGNFKDIPYPAEFKEKFDEVLESQLTSSQDRSQSIGKYKELFKKIGEAMLPFKNLVEKEAHTQAVFHGAFSHYSDIKLGELQENRALVLTEFQTGRGKRIDMLVHGIKFVDQASSAKEYYPVGLELKGPREGKTADALKDEANKQIADDYKIGVTYKTLTDGKEVAFMGVVFDKGANNAGSLVLPSKDEFASVKVVHSSIFSISQQQPGKRFDPNSCVGQSSRSKRSITNCLFSRDDVEKFSKGKVDENNVDKIIIDSEKFLTYVKNSQDEDKNAQLVEFIENKNIEGDYKYLVDKVIGDQGYERYIQNERIKDLYGDVLHQNSDLTKNPKLKSRLMNAAGGIQLIRGIHGAIVSCKDGTATDCGLNLGGIGWSFASQPIENVMVKITPRVVTSAEKVVGKIIPGTLGKQTKFVVQVAGVKFGSTIAKGVAGAVAGVFDIIDIGISANNLVDCKNRESSDNPCGEKEIRDNIASISFSGVSFVSGVALTAASMPVVGIGVGLGLMVGYGVYSGVSNIIEYEEKYDTTFGEDYSILWRTALFQDMADDVQHLADRKNTVDSLAKEVWKALNNAPNSVVAYGVGLGEVNGNTLLPDYAKILMGKEDTNTGDLSRVIPDSIPGASRICLPKVTGQDYEKGITSSVQPPLYYCENAMVISHDNRLKAKQKGNTIIYDLQNIDKGEIVGSNEWNNNFLIYPGTTRITGGNNVVNRFVVNNIDSLGQIIGGKNSTNILDLSQLVEDKVTGVIGYRFKPSAYGKLKVRINNRLLIDDYVSNNLFNYHYIGRQNKVDEVWCMGYSEHFTEIDDHEVIIDGGGGSNNNKKDIVENCKKVIISPYTTVKGRESNYTFYVKAADYKGKGLHSEIDVDGTGTVIFPEINLLGDCDQITYFKNSNTLSLKINFGQNNQFTLDVKNYVEQSSNKPRFALIDKNGSNIVPKIERSESATIKINSFELHSEYSLDKFDDVETHYKEILNNNKDYKVLSVVRDKTQSQDNSVVPHMVFGSSGNDVINFDQGTIFARGGKGSDVYVITDDINNKEVKIDNNSDDEKVDTLFIPEVEKGFSIQKCDLHLNYSNISIQVKNYLQDHNHRHFIIMNKKGEAFIPNIQSMSCSSSGKGKSVPFLQATQTQNMFLLPKDFADDHVVIDSNLEDIEKYKDKDDLLLIKENGNRFIIRIEEFYTNRSKWENISYSLWNNNDLLPFPELLEDVDNVMEYQDKLRDDYKKVVKEYIIDFSNSINIKHNQKLDKNISTSIGEDEERMGVIVLKNITPDQVEVSSSGKDLIFHDKSFNHTINVENWDNSTLYRISILEFDLGLEPVRIRGLDRFSLSEVGKIEDLIGKASENYQNRGKYTLKVENDFKCLTSVDGFERENKEPTYQCLGFSSLQDQVSFTENFCSLEQLTEFRDKSNSTQVSALSKSLQNNLLLNGYDQNIADKCSKLILAADKCSPENKLDLGGCLSERRKRSSDFCPVFLENIHNELNREENERRNVVVEESSIRVVTSDHETLDIENLPIREVVINDNINRKRSLRNTLDLRKLVQQINKDLGIKPISMVVKDASNLLIKLSISATSLQRDIITVRLKDALINKWYKKLQIIFNNTPMEIGDSLDLKPSLFISDKKIVVVRPQDIEEKNKIIISKKAGQYSYFHDKYDLIVTNAFDDNIEANELYIIYFRDFYKELKMKTLSISFADKEVLLIDEIDKIYNSESADKLNYVSSILNLQESSLPLEVSSSSDIEAQGKFKRTPLHFASEAGEWNEVRLLLNRGANIEVQDEFGYTPIFLATQLGKWSVVELLLDRGANIDAQDKEGKTLLHFAESGNNLDMIQFLLDRGANIEVQDKLGWTPILYAAQSGQWDVVKLLISNGAKFNNEITYQGTPLHFAVQEGNLDMVRFLLDKGADIEVQNAYNEKPLHLAVKAGRLNIVKLLLDRGANVNVTDMNSLTPLHLATKPRQGLEVVKHLIEEGADVNVKRRGRMTPLHLAAKSRQGLEMVKHFIEKGADVNVKRIDGMTPLHLAAKHRRLEVVKYLIEKGADVNVKRIGGMTPLHLAAENGELEVVKYLVEKGASTNAKDKDEKTPLELAIQGNYADIVEFFKQTQLDKELLISAEKGDLKKVRDSIKRGANVNASTADGRTPLDIARDKGYNNIVNYLEKKLDERKETPKQRKRPHHHGDHNSHHLSRKPLAMDLSNQPEIATSSGAKPSSWINGLLGWVKSSLDGLVSSVANKFAAKESEGSKSGDTDACPAGLEKMYSATIPQSRKSLGAPKENIPNRSWSSKSVTIVPEINTVMVNNALILGDLAVRLINGRRYKQPVHENLLSPSEQSMSSIDEDMIIRAIQQGKEKFGVPGTNIDEVEIIGNKTEIRK